MNDRRQYRARPGWLKHTVARGAAKRLGAAAVAAAACCAIAPSAAVAGDYDSNGTSTQHSTFGTKVHDATITTKVKATLADTRDLSSHDIHVRTRDGMVLLTGSVPDEQQRARAVSAVRQVNGVQGVRDQLMLHP